MSFVFTPLCLLFAAIRAARDPKRFAGGCFHGGREGGHAGVRLSGAVEWAVRPLGAQPVTVFDHEGFPFTMRIGMFRVVRSSCNWIYPEPGQSPCKAASRSFPCSCDSQNAWEQRSVNIMLTVPLSVSLSTALFCLLLRHSHKFLTGYGVVLQLQLIPVPRHYLSP